MGYKILSLDGGGTWALIEAMALRALFADAPGHEILARFDLAIANSGGSIVLGGLARNKRPSEIIALLQDAAIREAIFARVPYFRHLLSRVALFPRYSSAGKLAGLRRVFEGDGDRPLLAFSGPGWVRGPAGADVRLVIVAFDYDSLRARIFRSFATAHGAQPDDTTLACAIHASSNAPISFFDAPTGFGDHRFWDGAMGGNNNPLMVGLTECLGDGVAAQGITALSLGTGTTKLVPPDVTPPAPDALRESRRKPGIFTDLAQAAGCINDDPPDMATFIAHSIIASARGEDPTSLGSVVRLSPVIRPVLTDGAWTAPAGLPGDAFERLQSLEMDAVAQSDVDALYAMAQAWIAGTIPNQPIRMTWNFRNELGDATFDAAAARWQALQDRQ